MLKPRQASNLIRYFSSPFVNQHKPMQGGSCSKQKQVTCEAAEMDASEMEPPVSELQDKPKDSSNVERRRKVENAGGRDSAASTDSAYYSRPGSRTSRDSQRSSQSKSVLRVSEIDGRAIAESSIKEEDESNHPDNSRDASVSSHPDNSQDASVSSNPDNSQDASVSSHPDNSRDASVSSHPDNSQDASVSSNLNEKEQRESGDESKETSSCGPPQGEEIVLRNSSHGGAVSDASSGRESKMSTDSSGSDGDVESNSASDSGNHGRSRQDVPESSSNGQQQQDKVRRKKGTRPRGVAVPSQFGPQTAEHDMASDMPSQFGPQTAEHDMASDMPSQFGPQTAEHDMASDMPSQSGPNGNSTVETSSPQVANRGATSESVRASSCAEVNAFELN